MKKFTDCNIIGVGKRRDGGTRYWCLEHKADATAKYGKPSEKCRYAHIPSIASEELLDLDVDYYKGGIALWGAVPPIYDTTQLSIDRGIHVHARLKMNGKKEIDKTYRAVRLISERKGVPPNGLLVSELDAIFYMVTSMFGYEMKHVACTLCDYSHLDKDWFSIHAHRRHLCAGCGNYFRDTDIAIGNPIKKTQEIFGDKPREVKRVNRTKEINQEDFPGGIQIWGSNTAILWTSSRQEEAGIHIHAYREENGKRSIDNTYDQVTVDGITLDSRMVQIYMAQSALPHIERRVINAQCPKCKTSHFDTGDTGFTPHEKYVCGHCGHEYRGKSRLRMTIGNPIVGIIDKLAKNAPRVPQKHESNLLPETL